MPAQIADLGLEDVRAGLRDGSILIVDVRESVELAGGVIPGSISMPLSQFDPSALPVGDGRRLVFSCAAGARSRIAIEASQRAGLPLREHFVGGFKGWIAAGEPVAPYSQ